MALHCFRRFLSFSVLRLLFFFLLLLDFTLFSCGPFPPPLQVLICCPQFLPDLSFLRLLLLRYLRDMTSSLALKISGCHCTQTMVSSCATPSPLVLVTFLWPSPNDNVLEFFPPIPLTLADYITSRSQFRFSFQCTSVTVLFFTTTPFLSDYRVCFFFPSTESPLLFRAVGLRSPSFIWAELRRPVLKDIWFFYLRFLPASPPGNSSLTFHFLTP